MRTSPQVGIVSVWWEGNPCKSANLNGQISWNMLKLFNSMHREFMLVASVVSWDTTSNSFNESA